jgi:hypothetical protein
VFFTCCRSVRPLFRNAVCIFRKVEFQEINSNILIFTIPSPTMHCTRQNVNNNLRNVNICQPNYTPLTIEQEHDTSSRTSTSLQEIKRRKVCRLTNYMYTKQLNAVIFCQTTAPPQATCDSAAQLPPPHTDTRVSPPPETRWPHSHKLHDSQSPS